MHKPSLAHWGSPEITLQAGWVFNQQEPQSKCDAYFKFKIIFFQPPPPRSTGHWLVWLFAQSGLSGSFSRLTPSRENLTFWDSDWLLQDIFFFPQMYALFSENKSRPVLWLICLLKPLQISVGLQKLRFPFDSNSGFNFMITENHTLLWKQMTW